MKKKRGEFYLSQYNEHSGLNFSSKSLSNNTSMGFSFDFQIKDKINLIFDLKDTFYDINYDGKIDLVPYVNIGLNYTY